MVINEQTGLFISEYCTGSMSVPRNYISNRLHDLFEVS
jgi:hypothetical protein